MKWAIITGASSGLGAEFARQLSKDPSLRLMLVARRGDRLEELRTSILAGGGQAEVFAGDLTSRETREKLLQTVCVLGGQVGWLVNNAGFGYLGRFEEQTQENIENMIELNCTSLTLLTRAFLPLMERGSHVLNVASGAGFLPLPNFSVYAATKAYVVSISRALAYELRARGVSVTALCPGPVATEFLDVAVTAQGPAAGKDGVLVKWLTEAPQATVKRGLKGARCGCDVISSGLVGRSTRLLAKLLPFWILRRFAARAI